MLSRAPPGTIWALMSNAIVVRVVAVIVSAVFVLSSWLTTGTPDTAFLRYFSLAVLASTLSLVAWEKWLWKTSLAQRLPAVPTDVSGTWETRLESLWIDPSTGVPAPPKNVYIVIRQTFATASVRLISDESDSASSLARVVQENESWIVHYIYTNEPRAAVRNRSAIHHGSGLLKVVGRPAERIHGTYWTDRESKGELRLGRRRSKIVEDFAGAESLFGPPAS